MRKISKKISVVLALILMVTSFASMTASAASEKRIDIAGSKGSYITISNVIEEKDLEFYPFKLYHANAPVTVKFEGGSLARQSIMYMPNGKIQNGEFIWGENYEEVKFDVKKYVLYSYEDGNTNEVKETVVDSIPDDYYNNYFEVYGFAAGNYAILSKPGYYFINGAPEAEEGKSFIIQIGGETSEETSQVTEESNTLAAIPTSSKVLVNGKEVSFEAYNINGNNYFKLRDLAMVLNGTDKQFEVSWDSSKNAIDLESGRAYTSVGGELVVSDKLLNKEANPTTSKIYLNGEEVQLTAYNINGNNYFKLRDIAKVINFGVTWDGNTNTVGVDTTTEYVEE